MYINIERASKVGLDISIQDGHLIIQPEAYMPMPILDTLQEQLISDRNLPVIAAEAIINKLIGEIHQAQVWQGLCQLDDSGI